jgi:PAS domain S-box-containing protein
LKQQRKHQGLLENLSLLVAEGVDAGRTCGTLVREIYRNTGASLVSLEGVRNGKGLLDCRALSRGVRGTAAQKALTPLVGNSLGKKVPRPAIVLAGSREGRPLRALHLERVVIVPLRVRRTVVGALCVGFRGLPAGGSIDLRFMRALGAHASSLIGRLRSGEHLRGAVERYTALFHAVLEPVFILDPRDGTIVEVNLQGSRLAGAGRERLRGRKFHSLFPVQDHRRVRRVLERTKEGAPGVPLGPAEIIRKRGTRAPVEVSATRVSMDGRSMVVAFVRDVSEKARAEVKIAASEELVRIIVEGTLDVFFFVRGRTGAYTYVSPSVEKITGHSPEQWKKGGSGLLTRHSMNKHARMLTDRALRKGIAPQAFLCEIRHAEGNPLLLEFNERPIFRGGRVIGVQGVARDITEKKRLEETILESRDNLTRILDQTPLGVMVFDARGVLQDVNEAWMKLSGAKDKARIVGRINILHSAFTRKSGLTGAIADVYRGMTVDLPAMTVDFREMGPGLSITGEPRTVHVRMFPVTGRDARLVNAVAMIEDVTERRVLEEQLIQSQKMESVGLLAGGIAHDFNNILGGILGYASFVKEMVDKEADIYPHLETIERSALRAAELTSQLLAFARGGKYVVSSLSVNEMVRETAELLRGTIGKEVTVTTRLDTSGPTVEADASQIQQVLMNLCVNARDAMPHGGRLTIGTLVLREPDAFLAALSDVRRGPYVRIDVTDTGVGIDETIRGKIFDPFFTTKEKGKGTGLGLATVYGIVKNHGGILDVDSILGVGTTFSVYLPTTLKGAPAGKPEAPAARGGMETIMIVDDEETIRMLVKDILQDKGYQVMCAEDGMKAVSMYRENRHRIDLVILDMSMPGLTGKETFEKLKELNPDVKAILSTGYSRDERAREMLALGVRGFVQKPYRISHFAATVRKVLDTSAGGHHD